MTDKQKAKVAFSEEDKEYLTKEELAQIQIDASKEAAERVTDKDIIKEIEAEYIEYSGTYKGILKKIGIPETTLKGTGEIIGAKTDYKFKEDFKLNNKKSEYLNDVMSIMVYTAFVSITTIILLIIIGLLK